MRDTLQPGALRAWAEEVFAPEPEEETVAILSDCWHCGGDVDEREAEIIKGRVYHSRCADDVFPDNPSMDPGIPKEGW